ICKRLSELVGEGQDTGISRVCSLDCESRGVHAAGECRDGLIEFTFEVNRLPLVRCLTSRNAGEVSNDRGHSTTVLDDVAGVGSDAVEVGFIFDGFSQSENSKERIVQLMADSSCESSKAARFLGLDELVLQTAVIGRIPEDQTDPILSLVSPCHVEPLIVIPPRADLDLLSIVWLFCSHHGGQWVTGGVDDSGILCLGTVSASRPSEFFSQVLSHRGIDGKYLEQRDRVSRIKYGL